jgi:hypothetical protein
LQSVILHELESITFDQLAEEAGALDTVLSEGGPARLSI